MKAWPRDRKFLRTKTGSGISSGFAFRVQIFQRQPCLFLLLFRRRWNKVHGKYKKDETQVRSNHGQGLQITNFTQNYWRCAKFGDRFIIILMKEMHSFWRWKYTTVSDVHYKWTKVTTLDFRAPAWVFELFQAVLFSASDPRLLLLLLVPCTSNDFY